MAREKEVEYKTVTVKGKETADPAKIVKVVAVLRGTNASTGKNLGQGATRLAKKFEDILKQERELSILAEEAKKVGRRYVARLFDAKDEVYSRVLETASVVMSISKESERAKFDKDGFISAVIKLMPDLQDKILELQKEFTKFSKVAPSFKPELKEGFRDFIKGKAEKFLAALNSFFDKIKSWGEGYDKKLEKIKNRFSGVKVNESFSEYASRRLLTEDEELPSEESDENIEEAQDLDVYAVISLWADANNIELDTKQVEDLINSLIENNLVKA